MLFVNRKSHIWPGGTAILFKRSIPSYPRLSQFNHLNSHVFLVKTCQKPMCSSQKSSSSPSFSKTSPSCSHHFPTIFPSFPIISHGFPMLFPWFSHGYPMVSPRPDLGSHRGQACGNVVYGYGGDVALQCRWAQNRRWGWHLGRGWPASPRLDGYIQIYIYIYI